MSFGEEAFTKAAPDPERPAPSYTPELDRILALPRRPQPGSGVPVGANVPDLTPLYRAFGSTGMVLRPIQNAMLWEAAKAEGLFANVGVGHGKTLTTLLLPDALRSERAVLLVPAHVREQLLHKDIPLYSRHFQLPMDRITIVTYEELSNPRTDTILEDLAPDLIVADEAHRLRHKNAACTRRFIRYMGKHPATRCALLSGTLTGRWLTDYAHLLKYALKDGSPLPRGHYELQDWSAAIDLLQGDAGWAAPGALLSLLPNGPLHTALAQGNHLGPGSSFVRGAYRARLLETPGVVFTAESSLGTALSIRARRPRLPTVVQEALDALRTTWSIAGEEFDSAMTLHAYARQLAGGFYYERVWPGGVVDEEWLVAHNTWNCVVRNYLNWHNSPGMDSPAKLAYAVKAGRWPEGEEAYRDWMRVCHREPPGTRAVWVSDYLVNDALAWADERKRKGERGIIWYEHDAFGEALEARGMVRFAGGPTDALRLLGAAEAKGPAVIVCSRPAHGTGKNLQAFQHNYVATVPANGDALEQLLGRTHRPGQTADEVFADVCLQTLENEKAWARACEDGRHSVDKHGMPHKTRYANLLGTEDKHGT